MLSSAAGTYSGETNVNTGTLVATGNDSLTAGGSVPVWGRRDLGLRSLGTGWQLDVRGVDHFGRAGNGNAPDARPRYLCCGSSSIRSFVVFAKAASP